MKVVHLGGLDIRWDTCGRSWRGSWRFLFQGWETGRKIRQDSLFRDNFPLSIFQFLFSFFYFNCLLVLLKLEEGEG
jgi:hypothetical protein